MNDSERFWSRVNKTDTCWLWTGAKLPHGYGHFVAGSKKNGTRTDWRAHRWSYVQINGPIPKGLELDHLCRIPQCVRPDHLEAVTHRVNMLRGKGTGAINAQKTHCPRGHEYDAYLPKYGRRYCKTCNRIAAGYYKKMRRRGLKPGNPYTAEPLKPLR